MRPQNVLLGQLWFWFSVIGLLIPAFLILIFLILVPILFLAGEKDAALPMIGAIVGMLMLTMVAIPGIVVGRGLQQGREWARVPAIILGVLVIGHFPIGTALALYTFVTLFDSKLRYGPG
jgi:O-antigen/teichoic acid export membrane protein